MRPKFPKGLRSFLMVVYCKAKKIPLATLKMKLPKKRRNVHRVKGLNMDIFEYCKVCRYIIQAA